MIEVKKDKRQVGIGNASLWIGGKLIEKFDSEKELRYQAGITPKGKYLSIEDESLSLILIDYSAKDLRESGIIKATFRLNNLKLFTGIPIRSDTRRREVKILWNDENFIPFCYFFFDFDYQRWTKPYSYSAYKNQLSEEAKQLLKEKSGNVYFSSTINRSNDTARFTLNKDLTIKEQIYNFAKILNEANKEAFKKLETKKANSIQEFDFPMEVRTSCEQYLMYFADFLREIGVIAVTNIEHDKAGKTLFGVKPSNPKVALDAIREALEIYLELPMSPLVNEIEISDTRMLSLRAEINTLKSRLDYAQIRQIETEKRADLQRELIDAHKEILREKDNRIQTLQNFEPRHFEPSIIYESAIETNYVDAEIVEETNTEKITETSNKEVDLGLVTVKPAKIGFGVEANTPRLTRLGIKKGKELFEYLDKKFNPEEEK